MAYHGDSVRFDTDKIRADMRAYGVTATQLSRALGKNDAYITQMLQRGHGKRKSLSVVERALFREEGTYVLTSPVTEAHKEEDKGVNVSEIEQRIASLEEAFTSYTSATQLMLAEIIELQKGTNTQIMKLRSLMERVWEGK